MKYVTKNTWSRKDTGEVLGITYAENRLREVLVSPNKKDVEHKQKRAIQHGRNGGTVQEFRNSYGLLDGLDGDVPIHIGMEAVKLTDEVIEDIHARGQRIQGEPEPEGAWMSKKPLGPGAVFVMQHWVREDTGETFHSDYARNLMKQIIVFGNPDEASEAIVGGSKENSKGRAREFSPPFDFPADLDGDTKIHQEFSVSPATQEEVDAIHARGQRTSEDAPDESLDHMATLMRLLGGLS